MNAAVEKRRGDLEAIVASGPSALFATVSGAHLYGFESPDSDFDLRGAFVAPLEDVLGLTRAPETLSILEDRNGLELDWVAHDVHKFVRLMTRRNGYVLEQLYSPLVIAGGDGLEELRDLGRGCIVRHLRHHYRGFATGQRRLLDGGDETVKRLLYCYRVLLSGIHALRAGRIESNLLVLADGRGELGLEALVQRKREGAEKGSLEPGEAASHGAALDRLFEELDAAFEASSLPEAPTNLPALDDFVIRTRLATR